MKKTILFLLIAFFGWNEAITQDHPPDCYLPFDHDHEHTICFGYAMARAFGKSKLWPDSNKVHAEPAEGVDLDYFQTDNMWYKSVDVLQRGELAVAPGAIIVFYNQKEPVSGRTAQHASYVAIVPSSGGIYQGDYLPSPLRTLAGGQVITKDAAYYSTQLDDIVMHQVPNDYGSFEEVRLDSVIDFWITDGPWFRVFTAKNEANLSVTYHNSFPGAPDTGKMYFINPLISSSAAGNAIPEEVEFDVPLTEQYYFGVTRRVKAQDPQTFNGNNFRFTQNWIAWNSPREGNPIDITIFQSGDVTALFANSTTSTIQATLYGDGENLEGYLKVADTVKHVTGSSTIEYPGVNTVLVQRQMDTGGVS